MVGDYGVLNGQDIDWSGHAWPKVIDKRVLSDNEWHSLSYSIPPSPGTPPGGEWLVLRVDPPWKVRGDRRIFGVMTRDLKWIN